MADQSGSFGVSVACWIPLLWRPLPASAHSPERLAAVNRSNERHLKTLHDHEVRDPIPAELANLEALTIDVLRCVKQVPPARAVVLGGDRIEWTADNRKSSIRVGDSGLLQLFLEPELPQEVEFMADVDAVTGTPHGARIAVRLAGCSEHVLELYRELVFIYYRRARRVAVDAVTDLKADPEA